MVANYGNHSLYAVGLNDELTLCGRVRRLSRYRRQQREDRELQLLLQKYKIDISEYGYSLGSIENSFNRLNKYRVTNPGFNEESKAKAISMLHASYAIVRRSRLTFDYFEWMDMSASPGMPYSLKFKNKREALSDSRVYTYVVEKIERGEPPQGLWSQVCKTEPKKVVKIINNDARTILSAPLDVQAEATYLFATQNECIYEAGRRFRIPSTVGMTKYYKGWHNLYRRLYREGKLPRGLEADYTEYDLGVILDEFMIVANLRFSMFEATLQTPELMKRILNYYRDVIHSRVVMETGDVVQKHTGQPSGQTNTITDNSMINEFRWYYMWCEIMPDSFHSLEYFRNHCELIVCGDDSLLTVSPVVEKLFRPDKIKAISDKHGWRFKFASDDYEPVHKLSFCSQNFLWYYGYVLPVPNNVKKLLTSLVYGSKNRPDWHREVVSRVLGVRIEAFFLTNLRSLLDEYLDFLLNAYNRELKCKPPKDMLSYEEILICKRDYSQALALYLGDPEVSEVAWHPCMQGSVIPFDNLHVQDIKLL